MLTHNELKDIIDNLPMSVNKDDRNTTELIKKVGNQLGYAIPDCKCQDKWSDLSVKLKLWLRNHPEECHYTIRPGIVRKTPFGNCYNLSITDEMAIWLLENDTESSKWITKIVSEDAEDNVNVINQSTNESLSENVFAETAEPVVVETKKKTKSKTKNKL